LPTQLALSEIIFWEGLGIEAIKTPDRPLIPSIIFSMHKIKDSVEGRWMHTQKGTKTVWVEG